MLCFRLPILFKAGNASLAMMNLQNIFIVSAYVDDTYIASLKLLVIFRRPQSQKAGIAKRSKGAQTNLTTAKKR